MQSLNQKLLIKRTKQFEQAKSSVERVIKRYDKINAEFVSKFRRTDDPKITVSADYSIDITIEIPKLDAKFIWLKTEELFDLLNVSLTDLYEYQCDSLISFTKHFNGLVPTIVRIQFVFAKHCVPIKKEITREEIAGYRCE